MGRQDLSQPSPGEVGGSQKMTVFVEYRPKSPRSNGKIKFKLQMAQSFTVTTSTGDSEGIRSNDSIFCIELGNNALTKMWDFHVTCWEKAVWVKCIL